MNGRDHFRDVGVMLKCMKDITCEGVEWIQLDRDMVQWQAFVNTAMNICFPQKPGNPLTK
jgi:hypothetical protein